MPRNIVAYEPPMYESWRAQQEANRQYNIQQMYYRAANAQQAMSVSRISNTYADMSPGLVAGLGLEGLSPDDPLVAMLAARDAEAQSRYLAGGDQALLQLDGQFAAGLASQGEDLSDKNIDQFREKGWWPIRVLREAWTWAGLLADQTHWLATRNIQADAYMSNLRKQGYNTVDARRKVDEFLARDTAWDFATKAVGQSDKRGLARLDLNMGSEWFTPTSQLTDETRYRIEALGMSAEAAVDNPSQREVGIPITLLANESIARHSLDMGGRQVPISYGNATASRIGLRNPESAATKAIAGVTEFATRMVTDPFNVVGVGRGALVTGARTVRPVATGARTGGAIGRVAGQVSDVLRPGQTIDELLGSQIGMQAKQILAETDSITTINTMLKRAVPDGMLDIQFARRLAEVDDVDEIDAILRTMADKGILRRSFDPVSYTGSVMRKVSARSRTMPGDKAGGIAGWMADRYMAVDNMTMQLGGRLASLARRSNPDDAATLMNIGRIRGTFAPMGAYLKDYSTPTLRRWLSPVAPTLDLRNPDQMVESLDSYMRSMGFDVETRDTFLQRAALTYESVTGSRGGYVLDEMYKDAGFPGYMQNLIEGGSGGRLPRMTENMLDVVGDVNSEFIYQTMDRINRRLLAKGRDPIAQEVIEEAADLASRIFDKTLDTKRYFTDLAGRSAVSPGKRTYLELDNGKRYVLPTAHELVEATATALPLFDPKMLRRLIRRGGRLGLYGSDAGDEIMQILKGVDDEAAEHLRFFRDVAEEEALHDEILNAVDFQSLSIETKRFIESRGVAPQELPELKSFIRRYRNNRSRTAPRTGEPAIDTIFLDADGRTIADTAYESLRSDRFKGVVGDKADDMMEFLLAAQNNVWKPLVMLRPAYIFRVLGEEQFRMWMNGYRNVITAPVSFLALAIKNWSPELRAFQWADGQVGEAWERFVRMPIQKWLGGEADKTIMDIATKESDSFINSQYRGRQSAINRGQGTTYTGVYKDEPFRDPRTGNYNPKFGVALGHRAAQANADPLQRLAAQAVLADDVLEQGGSWDDVIDMVTERFEMNDQWADLQEVLEFGRRVGWMDEADSVEELVRRVFSQTDPGAPLYDYRRQLAVKNKMHRVLHRPEYADMHMQTVFQRNGYYTGENWLFRSPDGEIVDGYGDPIRSLGRYTEDEIAEIERQFAYLPNQEGYIRVRRQNGPVRVMDPGEMPHRPDALPMEGREVEGTSLSFHQHADGSPGYEILYHDGAGNMVGRATVKVTQTEWRVVPLYRDRIEHLSYDVFATMNDINPDEVDEALLSLFSDQMADPWEERFIIVDQNGRRPIREIYETADDAERAISEATQPFAGTRPLEIRRVEPESFTIPLRRVDTSEIDPLTAGQLGPTAGRIWSDAEGRWLFVGVADRGEFLTLRDTFLREGTVVYSSPTDADAYGHIYGRVGNYDDYTRRIRGEEFTEEVEEGIDHFMTPGAVVVYDINDLPETLQRQLRGGEVPTTPAPTRPLDWTPTGRYEVVWRSDYEWQVIDTTTGEVMDSVGGRVRPDAPRFRDNPELLAGWRESQEDAARLAALELDANDQRVARESIVKEEVIDEETGEIFRERVFRDDENKPYDRMRITEEDQAQARAALAAEKGQLPDQPTGPGTVQQGGRKLGDLEDQAINLDVHGVPFEQNWEDIADDILRAFDEEFDFDLLSSLSDVDTESILRMRQDIRQNLIQLGMPAVTLDINDDAIEVLANTLDILERQFDSPRIMSPQSQRSNARAFVQRIAKGKLDSGDWRILQSIAKDNPELLGSMLQRAVDHRINVGLAKRLGIPGVDVDVLERLAGGPLGDSIDRMLNDLGYRGSGRHGAEAHAARMAREAQNEALDADNKRFKEWEERVENAEGDTMEPPPEDDLFEALLREADQMEVGDDIDELIDDLVSRYATTEEEADALFEFLEETAKEIMAAPVEDLATPSGQYVLADALGRLADMPANVREPSKTARRRAARYIRDQEIDLDDPNATAAVQPEAPTPESTPKVSRAQTVEVPGAPPEPTGGYPIERLDTNQQYLVDRVLTENPGIGEMLTSYSVRVDDPNTFRQALLETPTHTEADTLAREKLLNRMDAKERAQGVRAEAPIKRHMSGENEVITDPADVPDDAIADEIARASKIRVKPLGLKRTDTFFVETVTGEYTRDGVRYVNVTMARENAGGRANFREYTVRKDDIERLIGNPKTYDDFVGDVATVEVNITARMHGELDSLDLLRWDQNESPYALRGEQTLNRGVNTLTVDDARAILEDARERAAIYREAGDRASKRYAVLYDNLAKQIERKLNDLPDRPATPPPAPEPTPAAAPAPEAPPADLLPTRTDRPRTLADIEAHPNFDKFARLFRVAEHVATPTYMKDNAVRVARRYTYQSRMGDINTDPVGVIGTQAKMGDYLLEGMQEGLFDDFEMDFLARQNISARRHESVKAKVKQFFNSSKIQDTVRAANDREWAVNTARNELNLHMRDVRPVGYVDHEDMWNQRRSWEDAGDQTELTVKRFTGQQAQLPPGRISEITDLEWAWNTEESLGDFLVGVLASVAPASSRGSINDFPIEQVLAMKIRGQTVADWLATMNIWPDNPMLRDLFPSPEAWTKASKSKILSRRLPGTGQHVDEFLLEHLDQLPPDHPARLLREDDVARRVGDLFEEHNAETWLDLGHEADPIEEYFPPGWNPLNRLVREVVETVDDELIDTLPDTVRESYRAIAAAAPDDARLILWRGPENRYYLDVRPADYAESMGTKSPVYDLQTREQIKQVEFGMGQYSDVDIFIHWANKYEPRGFTKADIEDAWNIITAQTTNRPQARNWTSTQQVIDALNRRSAHLRTEAVERLPGFQRFRGPEGEVVNRPIPSEGEPRDFWNTDQPPYMAQRQSSKGNRDIYEVIANGEAWQERVVAPDQLDRGRPFEVLEELDNGKVRIRERMWTRDDYDSQRMAQVQESEEVLGNYFNPIVEREFDPRVYDRPTTEPDQAAMNLDRHGINRGPSVLSRPEYRRIDRDGKPMTEWAGKIDQFTEQFFNIITAAPANMLTRGPVWRESYLRAVATLWGHATPEVREQIIEHFARNGIHASTTDFGFFAERVVDRFAKDRGDVVRGRLAKLADDAKTRFLRDEMPAPKAGISSLKELDEMAQHIAAYRTKQLLFDATQRNNFFDQFAIVFPFGDAFAEVFSRWSKMLVTDPYAIRNQRRIANLQTALQGGMYRDEYYSNPTAAIITDDNGDQQLVMPWSPWMSRIMAGHSENARIYQGTNVENLTPIGAGVIPGIGSFTSVPLGFVFEQLPDPVRNSRLVKTLFPFGTYDPSIDGLGGAFQQLTGVPTWGKKIADSVWAATFGVESLTEQSEVRLGNKIKTVLAWGHASGRYRGGNPVESQDEVNDATRVAIWLQFLEGLGQWGVSATYSQVEIGVAAPDEIAGAIDFESKLGLSQRYRNLLESTGFDYEETARLFLERYGVPSYPVLQSLSSQQRPSPVTGESRAFMSANQEIADDYPYGFYWLNPDSDEDEFLYESLAEAYVEGERIYLPPDEFQRRIERAAAYSLLDIRRAELELAYEQGRITREDQDRMLAYYRDMLRDEFDGYVGQGLYNEYDPRRAIEQIDAMVGTYGKQGDPRVTQFDMYQPLRALNHAWQAASVVSQMYSPSGSRDWWLSSSNEQAVYMRTQFMGVVQTLAANDKRIFDVWNGVYAKMFASDNEWSSYLTAPDSFGTQYMESALDDDGTYPDSMLPEPQPLPVGLTP